MARTGIYSIKSPLHLKRALAYIQQNYKTNEGLLIDSYYCTPDWAYYQFEFIRSKEVIQKGNNLAWHLHQDFAPDDNVTPEQALEIGEELMSRFYPNYQYVIATHVDREHIHNHIILNSVDFKTYHKLNCNPKSIAQLRAVSDDICLENKLSVIDKDGTLYQKRDLREAAYLKIDDYFNRCFNKITRDTRLNNDAEQETVNESSIMEENTNKLMENNFSENDISEELKKNFSMNFLKGLDKIENSINETVERYVSKNETEIAEKTGDTAAEFLEVIKKNIARAFEKFKGTEQKRKSPKSPTELKKHMQEVIFTAVEQTYNHIPEEFNHKKRLTMNLNKAIKEAADYDSFLGLMQKAGYEVKFGGKKGPAFKDEKMERFMYARSISLDYTEEMIKYRIKNHKEPPETVKKRTVYDDKIKVRSKRTRLKTEIDASIKKANTFEEFIADMERKKFEVKQGAHIAFRDLGRPMEKGKEPKFLRGKSLGYHYTEEAIRFRIAHKEVYKKMTDSKIDKVIPILNKDDGNLISWKKGENLNIKIASSRWIADNLLERYGIDFKVYNEGKIANNELFGLFLEEYDKQKELIRSVEDEIKKFDESIKDIQKHVNALESYWKLKPQLIGYSKMDLNSLSESELKEYKSFVGKWRYATDMLESAEKKYETLSTREMREMCENLKKEQLPLREQLVELKLDFETWENIKYNFVTKEGFGFLGYDTEQGVEKAKRVWEARKLRDAEARQKQAEKAERREARKESVKRIFGLSK